MAIHNKNESGQQLESDVESLVLKFLKKIDKKYSTGYKIFQRSKKHRGTLDRFEGKRAVEDLNGNYFPFEEIVEKSYNVPVYFKQEPYLKESQIYTDSLSTHDGRLYLPSQNSERPFWDCLYEIKKQNVTGSVIEKITEGFAFNIIESTNSLKEKKLSEPHHFWTKQAGLLLSGDVFTEEKVQQIQEIVRLAIHDKEERRREAMPKLIINQPLNHFRTLFKKYIFHLEENENEQGGLNEIYTVNPSA